MLTKQYGLKIQESGGVQKSEGDAEIIEELKGEIEWR
jgi:hypothetical protein